MSTATTKKQRIPLWGQIFIGLILGCLLGMLWPEIGAKLQPVGTAFIKAIKMIVMPLVFSSVTLGIYKMGSDLKSLGKLGGFAFLWCYIATGLSIVLGITLALVFNPGAGVDLTAGQSVPLPAHLGQSINWVNFFLDLIPDNVVAAIAGQKIIPTLFFAICFGLCLAKIGDKARPITNVLEGLMEAMFKLTQGIVATAPIAVTGIMAWVFATQGLKGASGHGQAYRPPHHRHRISHYRQAAG